MNTTPHLRLKQIKKTNFQNTVTYFIHIWHLQIRFTKWGKNLWFFFFNFSKFICFPSCDRDHGDGRERYTEREKTYSFHISLERQLKGNIPCLKVKLKLIVEHKTKQNITKQNKTKWEKWCQFTLVRRDVKWAMLVGNYVSLNYFCSKWNQKE